MGEKHTGRSPGGTPLPDATQLTLDRVVEELRLLRSAAGHPSYADIAKRIAHVRAARGVPSHEQKPARATVYDCFRTGRRRLDIDLVADIVQALGHGAAEVYRWRQLCVAAQQRTDATQVVTAYAELPTRAGPFVGRGAECDAVMVATADVSEPHVVAIQGMPGSGKSYLAAHVARRLRDSGRIDDVIYVDLRGYHHEAPPADQGAVLEAVLRLLGVPGRELPTDLATRRDLFRRRIGDRRYAIILDDAISTEQVDPLLPDCAGSIALITSRLSLDNAALSRGARFLSVSLDVFSEADAMALLTRIVGADRIGADRESAADLVEAAGLLPLAVSATAARVAGKPDWSLADHVGSLVARRQTLRLDDRVRATLELSYATLSSGAKEILRLFAVQPCVDLDSASIGALAGADAASTLRNVNELVRQHLVEAPRPDRYAMHALIRTYGLDRSNDDDRPVDRAAALQRLVRHVVDQAWQAQTAANGSRSRGRRKTSEASTEPGPAATSSLRHDEKSARSWLEANIDTIVTLAGRGHDLGWRELTVQLSEASAWWLNQHGRYSTARLLHGLGLEAARATGDHLGETRARLDLGQILVRLSDWDAATEHLTWASTELEKSGDQYGALSAMNALAVMAAHRGRSTDSIDYLQQCLRLARITGFPHAVATTLDNLAVVYRRTGRVEEALTHHRMAYEEATRGEDWHMQAQCLANMSDVQLALGAHDDALRSAQRAMEMGYEMNNMLTVALGATNIGGVWSARGEYEQAIEYHSRALDVLETMGQRHLEASVHTDAGHANLALGRTVEARRHFDHALSLGVTIGDTYEQARALDGLGHVCAAEESPDAARRRWIEALTLFDDLGAAEATDVRTRLAGLATTTSGGATTM